MDQFKANTPDINQNGKTKGKKIARTKMKPLCSIQNGHCRNEIQKYKNVIGNSE